MQNKPRVLFIRYSMFVCATITIAAILSISAYILITGLPNVKPSLFALEYNSENVSLFPSLINTLTIMIAALLCSVPIGIAAAVYLNEYASKSSNFVKIVRIATETLSGIPSIVYGLFGMLLFVMHLKFGYSIVAGSFTLAIMVLPVIMRTAEEALLAVPDIYREGSFGLGAGKLRTIFSIILPTAFPGIFAGIILSIGRIFGETAALIFTAGTVPSIAESFSSSGSTLAVHLYRISSEGLYMKEASATAAILFIMVIIINSAAFFAVRKIGREKNG
ncbi:MAG: phosphate ABC transporter permease PstA [Chitinivibrionia bacterium]|nr:phosphate ABC transporter permease PstA [Chitinivibrionia bacterium]